MDSTSPAEGPAASMALPALTSDSSTELLLREYARTRDRAIRDRLVVQHERVVRYLAARFPSRSVPQEDIIQVGYIGLIHALDRYDPARGVSFLTYAIPTILGEIKRYFRDQTWMLKAPRRLRELGLTLQKLRFDLEQQLGRPPTVAELAAEANLTEEELVRAMDVDKAYLPASLDARMADSDGSDGGSFGDTLGVDDPAFGIIEEREALRLALEDLDERLRQIVRLRYFDELPQTAVAGRMGISQMHVSRLERQALSQLQKILADRRS
jgi:RNA polymerase sigma-B factor